MNKQQQLEELRTDAASLYQAAQRANGQAYHKDMKRYREMVQRVSKLEKEIKVDAAIRQADLAKIHIARKDLGLDEDVYRMIIKRVTHDKKSSSAKLNPLERTALLNEFRRLGWKPERRKYSPRSFHKEKHQKSMIDKIRALWIQMHKEGVTDSGTEKALGQYCMRMVQKHSPDWLTREQQPRVLESLKQWRKRVWKQWYDEDMEQIKRIADAEGGIEPDRVRQMITDNLIRYHDEFAEWGIEPPK